MMVLLFSAAFVTAAPPNPHTFVPNRAAKPSIVLAKYMRANISGGIRNFIFVWNRSYDNPTLQVADMMKIFDTLSNSPVLPKQMLENQEFQLYRLLDTKKMLKALDRYQKTLKTGFRSLFEYSSLIVGTKDGSMNKAYKKMNRDMKKVVKSYNHLAKVTNKQYGQNIMPYYELNYKK